MLGIVRKIVLYSSISFGVKNTWTIIPWLRRFNISFWGASKQFNMKLQIWKNVFKEFQGLPYFPRNTFICLLNRFGIMNQYSMSDMNQFRPLTNFRRDLQQTPTYRESFEEFQILRCSFGIMDMYLPTKFGILKPWTNISLLRSFT